ncbi:hypothetical protein K492DRAFT_155386 [Lichtheimia hyalospora FSU 10163]|nr:hypothetical protein K492DRAFT_155386 [Lichtheimia hyalospora FSU 10163]
MEQYKARPTKQFLRRNSAPSVDGIQGPDAADFGVIPSTSIMLSRSTVLDKAPSAAASSTPPVPTPTPSMQAARTHQHRLNAAQEQRTYQDSRQRLLSHIGTVMGICEDLKRERRFPVQYAKQPFSVLGLDMKMGHQAVNDIHKLESGTLSSLLLEDKLSHCLGHLDNLRGRVADTSSKVLVTGDLNSGKSTFVNALLKRELMPADQQPCTNMFCEVLDATLNDGVEEAHAIPNVTQYNRLDSSTYHVIEMRHLNKIIMDEQPSSRYQMLKVYTSDRRSTNESLLHNGVVDIALIDSPGLNTDSVKTTAIFARQEEIDVVVFVVSAENHFTLSGKEFLLNAANEKTHIFIVVNRFDSIRDKERCKRLVLEQIRQLSPATYADAEDLVHFVSAGNIDISEQGTPKAVDAPEFARLEQRLRAFVLENRAKSKLQPAKHYMVNLLRDVSLLSESNRANAAQASADAKRQLEMDQPAYEHLLQLRDRLLHRVEKMASMATGQIQRQAAARLEAAVQAIGEHTVDQLEYPGILLIWQYAQDLADCMSQRLFKEVRQQENVTRRETTAALESIHTMAIEHLGEFPVRADVDSMKRNRHCVTIDVEATDFFDLDEKLSGCAISLGAALAIGSRMMGVKDVVSSLGGVSNIRRMVIPALGIASAGLVLYVVSDMRSALERKLVRKFQAAARDSAHAEQQARRMARESRKVLRVEGWDIQARLQKAIETKENQRNEMTAVVHTSQESIEYFTALLEKSDQLLDKVASIQTDSTTRLYN